VKDINFKRDYSILVLLKNNQITKNKKTLVGATAKPEKSAFKAITLLVEKGHSVLAIGQNAKLLE
jgi:predicted CoA-binding protein